MSYIKYLEEKRKEEIVRNIEKVGLSIKNNGSDYDDKINKYIEKHGLNKEFIDKVKEIITTNEDKDIVYLISSLFYKEPTRQNFSEVMAYKYLVENLKDLKDVEIIKLNSGNKGSLRFNKIGELLEGGIKKHEDSKSVDFKLIIKDEIYYITQKYTKDFGGHQDNQYNDVVDFLNKGSINHKVIALLDGAYWDVKSKNLIDSYSNNENVYILSCDELIIYVNDRMK